MSRRKNKKYTFSLFDVDTEKVHKKYGIVISSYTSSFTPKNTTKICELNKNSGTPETISFLDESKRSHTCSISMIDFKSQMNVCLLKYNCFWCKHVFETKCIGCPIKFVSSKATKSYHSEISKDIYTIKENVTSGRANSIDDKRISISGAEYYETDGVFCSFNCCQSYIMDNKHNRLYDMSHYLLMKMYNELVGTKTVVISPAPHWRLLTSYGGHLTIKKFRDDFNKVEYESHGITNLPNFKPSCMLFEENIKF
jgi:hypothetical protein